MTVILRVRKKHPSRRKIASAASVLKKGGLVAFPTETVYGLGADAFNREAIKRIFTVKGRPLDNPLIVHIAHLGMVEKLARSFPPQARLLCETFWPGPLTVVLNKKAQVPDEVTAGGKTVAIRMPDHPVALRLIEAAGVPLVAPSANLSGRPSPTRAGHVEEDLLGRIDLILDGGRTFIGMESTVVDLTGNRPRILRPGAITAEDIEAVIGLVIPYGVTKNRQETPKSPGMKYRHYSPRTRLILLSPDDSQEKIDLFIKGLKAKDKNVAVITFKRGGRYEGCIQVYAGSKPMVVARRLFHIFRHLDKLQIDLIVVEPYHGQGGMSAMIEDRLKKAAGGKVGLTDERNILEE